MAVNPNIINGPLGASPKGAAFSLIGDSIAQFLSMYMNMQEKEKDRKARASDTASQKDMEQQRINQEGKRIDLEAQGQRTSAAGALRGQLTGGSYDDPNQVNAIKAAFKGTPYEALFQDKSSLPSTQMSDAGTTSQPSQPYGFLQPTSQEDRDKLLMKMEQAKEDRDTAEAPLRKQVLQNQSVTSSPDYLEQRLKEQHGFDLDEIRAKVRASFDTGKKTSFDDDMRTFINGMKALDTITDPSEHDVAQTALMGFLSTMKTKYPQLQQMAGPQQNPCATDPSSDACLSTKTPPAAPPGGGGGIMDSIKKFLGGGNNGVPAPKVPGGRITPY